MTPKPEWIAQQIERDNTKAEGEKAARRALHFASRAARLFSEADCPRFAAKAMEAAALLSEVSK